MPEAAMHEDDRLPFRQYYIRIARQVLPLDAETQPEAVQYPPNGHFRWGVLAADSPHNL
jgi:hypothetical protein